MCIFLSRRGYNIANLDFLSPIALCALSLFFATFRVDGIVFGDDVIVCLEVDENKHQEYECDEHRMHLVTAELLQKYPEHVVSWVRVNPTVDAKSQWSKKSQKIRETHFEDAVMIVSDILETRDTRVVYVGFD